MNAACMCALAPYEPFHDDMHVVQDSNRCLGGADQAAKTVDIGVGLAVVRSRCSHGSN